MALTSFQLNLPNPPITANHSVTLCEMQI